MKNGLVTGLLWCGPVNQFRKVGSDDDEANAVVIDKVTVDRTLA